MSISEALRIPSERENPGFPYEAVVSYTLFQSHLTRLPFEGGRASKSTPILKLKEPKLPLRSPISENGRVYRKRERYCGEYAVGESHFSGQRISFRESRFSGVIPF